MKAGLSLDTLREGLNYKIVSTVATENKGLYEGLQWLAGTLPQGAWCNVL